MMKRIEFLALHATDFKVYRDFTFDFASFGPGCHSIRGRNNVNPRLGSNGVGKSSLWDALCFSLYGKTAKRLRHTDVQPYGSKANPMVSLRLKVDGVPHHIVRRAVPHSLMLDDGACNQERIDGLLGIGIDLFLHTVLLAQGCPLFLDLEPRFKLTLLSDVLGLDRFETYSKRALTQADALGRDKQKLLMRSESVCGAIAEVGRELSHARQQSEQWQVAKQDEIRGLADQWRNTKVLLREAEAEVATLSEEQRNWTARLNAAAASMMLADAQRDMGTILQRQSAKLRIGDPCPTCTQPVHERAIEALDRQARHLIASSGYDKAKAKYDKHKGTLARLQQDLTQAVRVERTTRDAHTVAELAMRGAEQTENPFTSQRHKLKQRLDELGREERGIAKQTDALDVRSNQVIPWVGGFKDLRLIVLDNLLSSLSVLTTSYANELGLDCTAKFSVDRATKSGTLVTGVHLAVDGQERFEAWSGGEAQRLRLAASLALSASLLTEAGVSVNLLALDEPSAHLSPEGLNELTAFLSTHAEAEARTIYLTDQRPLRVASTVLLERNPDNVLLRSL